MKKIVVPVTEANLLFDVNAVLCLQGVKGNTIIYVKDEQQPKGWREVVTGHTLKYFENQLCHNTFKRVSKSMIIGLYHVTGVIKNHTVTLYRDCCGKILVSKIFCNDILGLLKQKEIL